MIEIGKTYTNNRGIHARVDKIADGRVYYTATRHYIRGRVGSTGSKLIHQFIDWKRGGPVEIDPLWEWLRDRESTKRPMRNIVLPGVQRAFPAVEVQRERGLVKLIVHRADEMVETVTFDETGARIGKEITVPEGRVESQL